MNWKNIKNYEDYYEISETGIVRSKLRLVNNKYPNSKSIRTSRVIKPHLRQGYLTIDLSRKSKHKILPLHRLIAQAFIPNPLNLPIINHKNGIKTDNRIENLEWCNHSHNTKHAIANKMYSPSGPKKLVLNINTGIFYESMRLAAESVPVAKHMFWYDMSRFGFITV